MLEQNATKEIWIDIENFDNLYQVSNMGNVRSFYNNNVKNLKPILRGIGYQYVNLYKNKISKGYLIHRLVAQAFIPNLDNEDTVNHINGIKIDNKVENLEWCSQSYNNFHANEIGLKDDRKPVLMSTLDNIPLVWFKSLSEASKLTKTDISAISKCCREVYKTSNGYKWEFYKEELNSGK